MGWVVNSKPRPLHARKSSGTYCLGGCVAPRAVLDGRRMSRHPPRLDPWTVQPIAQSLYRLSYSGPLKYCNCCSKFRTGFVFSVPYFIGEESSLNCNFMRPESCRGWEDLSVTTSLEHPVPPLFDYRWNGKYRYLWHVSVFHKAVALLVPLLCWCI